MYAKAIYRTIISMTPFYLENVLRWVKMAVWDAPVRFYLDVDLEKTVIEKEIFMEIQHLSRVRSRECSRE